ncbi:MAG: tetracycline resistance MFS efflux pump [Crocinitomicaceae bacterium]|nr:tetracycline resistance MFS efflux pump [Crocinitomicaceae bacterium]
MAFKRKTASIIFIFITVLVDIIGIGIIIPVIPDLIISLDPSLIKLTDEEALSKASEIGGWLMFAFAFVQFFFAPVLGELSDRFGRKPVLIMALFGLGLDYIFHAMAPTVFWLFVGRVIAGFFGASYTVAYSYIADISKPEEKAKNFGMIGAAFGLGFIIGPVVGGVAAQWGIYVPFYVAAGLSLLNMVYGLAVLPESLKKENRRKIEIKNLVPGGALFALRKYPQILGLVAAYFFIYLAGKSVESIWTYYTMFRFEWSVTQVGYSLGVVGILVTIVQGGLIGRTVKFFGQKKTILIGYIFWVSGLILFGLANQGWMMYAFTVVYTMGGVAGPTIQSLMSNEVADDEQGELQGALTSLVSITTILGPPLFTFIFSYFTSDASPISLPGASFFLGASLALVSMIFATKSLLKHH